MFLKTTRFFILLIVIAVLSVCGACSSSDTDTDDTQNVQCPAPLVVPETSGCDGLLLTDPASVETQSAGITTTTGPGGAAALLIGDDQSIDIKDEGCLQLGKDGADFSLSLWLKATGSSQIIGTTDQYGRGQGFIMYTNLRSDGDLELGVESASATGWVWAPASVPFKPGVWTHVGLRYDNNGDGSTFTTSINLDTHTAQAAPDVYNEKLRVGDQGWGSIAPFEISELHSYGRLLSDRELKALFVQKADAVGISASELTGALDRLQAHVGGQTLLSTTELNAEVTRFVRNALFLETDKALMQKALDLVQSYETTQGPLFMTDATRNGIPRTGTDGDGLELARAMFSIQQTVLEKVFTPENVANCSMAVLEGRRFLTADYFPGKAEPPADPTKSYDVTISANVPAFWGRPVAFATEPVRRPTGLYLSPGSIGKVTVPAEMINAGYSVLVGAHTADHSNKSNSTRLDRVTLTFPITQKVTHIANPLGGGVYIIVPYLADLGLVKVSISGVIEAPFFSQRSFDKTTAQEWQTRRTAPGPWADYETDKFMMQVPSSWIYASGDPTAAMQDWDKAMDGVSELLGYPPEKRNRTVLYEQIDVQIRHGVFGIGYPQINNSYNPNQPENGNNQSWLLTNPSGFEIDYHELGHAQLMSMFRGETEAINNFLHAYVRNVKFGVEYDLAFQQSFGPSYGGAGVGPDAAAIDWMVTENFRNGREMDYSNTTKDEFRYQQRGYAKYSDIYKVFGWQALRDFFHQEHLDYMAKTPSDGLDAVDSRILRLSVAAGADLTALIHFWGIHPVDPATLKQRMADKGLVPSPGVKARLEYYKTIAPKNNADFVAQCDRMFSVSACPITPNADPDYGIGWYNGLRDVFNETHAAQIQTEIQHVLDLYYP